MQVYNNNRARAQGRNGFFFRCSLYLCGRDEYLLRHVFTEVALHNFYDLLLIVTLRRLECGLKFYYFLIDIEEEIQGLLTSITDCVNPEGTAFRQPTLPSILRISYSFLCERRWVRHWGLFLQIPTCFRHCFSYYPFTDVQPPCSLTLSSMLAECAFAHPHSRNCLVDKSKPRTP
jgi:hypothetical protein